MNGRFPEPVAGPQGRDRRIRAARWTRRIDRFVHMAIGVVALLLPLWAGAIATGPYLPLNSGTTWTYARDGSGAYVTEVLEGSYVVNGVATKALFHGKDSSITYLTNDSSGIREHAAFVPSVAVNATTTWEMITLSPPLKDAEPAMDIGATVPSSGTASIELGGIETFPLSYTGNSTLVGFETITVPAGTFDTVKVTVWSTVYGYIGTEYLSGSGMTIYWLAEGIGPVKEVITHSDGTTTTYTLLDSNLFDTAPDAFAFTAQTGVAPGAPVTSDSITVAGINAPAPIGVVGGEYSIGGGAFTSAAGTISNGQTVRVRLTSAATPGTLARATLTIGGVSANFDVTTASAAGSAKRNDFSGDGKSDLFWRNVVDGRNYVWVMDGAAHAETQLPSVGTGFQVVAVADFNGDGRMDLLWRNSTDGRNYVWLMNAGGTSRTEAQLPNVPAAFEVAGVGDFNFDGKADLLWRHASDGRNYLWLMNGASRTETQLPSVGAAYQVAATADYDGNGSTDIAWRHATSGQVYQWLIDPTTLARTETLIGTVSPANFSVITP